jgi:SAM-dependent methyltransferase
MGTIKRFFRTAISKGVYYLLPRSLRHFIIKFMVLAEESAPPKDATRSLLEVYDNISYAINQQCIRWGNGVHIKHELMDGIHSFFYERIPPHSNVLDLGCGRGTVANAIAQNTDSRVLGIDFDIKQIAFAKDHYQSHNLQFMAGNVFTDIPKDDSFEVIVLSSVLEHLDQRIEFLKSLIDRFHPRKFLIRVPLFDQHHFKALKRELGMFPYADSTHVLEYSTQTFTEEMGKAGLNIKHLEIHWGDIWAECIPNNQ